jgi:hypothetical protein
MSKIVRTAMRAFAAAALCAGVASPTVFGAKPVAAPDTPIQVTFRNAASPADRLLSDNVSPSYSDGYTGVQARIAGSTGSVQLFTCVSTTTRGKTTCNSQGRGQTFDFRDPLAQFLPPPYPTVTQGAQMQIWVFADDGVNELANGFRAVMNYVGEQRRAGSKTNFDINGVMHTVRFTPNMYANSDYLLVTYLRGSLSCSTADPSKCATWSVEASSTYGDIAEFVTGDNSKDYGQFHMPFRITVSVLPK